MPSPSPLVILISSDLLFGSRVSAVADNNGCDFAQRGAADQLVEEFGADRDVLVVIDLSHADPADVTVALEAGGGMWSAIAYGPHVQTGRLESARAAGLQRVLTRGQFDMEMNSIVGKFAMPS